MDIHELDVALRQSRRRNHTIPKLKHRARPVKADKLPADLGACLTLPAGLDVVWLNIEPATRPSPETLTADARRNGTSPALELAKIISRKKLLRFRRRHVPLDASSASLSEKELTALKEALALRGVSSDPAGAGPTGSLPGVPESPLRPLAPISGSEEPRRLKTPPLHLEFVASTLS